MIDKIAKSPVQFAVAGGVVLLVGYFVLKRSAAVAAETAVGVVSGNNALTRGTPYEGKGVVGTLGAAANTASGGYFQSIGESLGGWIYDVTHREYDPSSGLQTPAKTVADGARETDTLWGRIGSVLLRSN